MPRDPGSIWKYITNVCIYAIHMSLTATRGAERRKIGYYACPEILRRGARKSAHDRRLVRESFMKGRKSTSVQVGGPPTHAPAALNICFLD
jgi:hypothetical protein